MNKMFIELDLEDDIAYNFLEDSSTRRHVDIVVNGSEYEVNITSSSVTQESSPWYNSRGVEFKFVGNKTITLTASLSDKKAKQLREAKSAVRSKQREFKEAQRKLSELMGN